MAWTPLAETKEAGWREPLADPVPSEEERTLGPPVEGLAPHEWLVLGRVFERRPAKEIAAEMRCSVATVRGILAKPAFKRAVEVVEGSIVERISRGEFGVLAIYKANAVGAARRIVGMSKASEDERVRFQANLKIIEGAGIKPPTPVVYDTPERLMDQFNAEELEAFARDGVFPERFKDQMARLGMAALEKAEQQRWEPRVEQPALANEASEPVREPAKEVVEEVE